MGCDKDGVQDRVKYEARFKCAFVMHKAILHGLINSCAQLLARIHCLPCTHIHKLWVCCWIIHLLYINICKNMYCSDNFVL